MPRVAVYALHDPRTGERRYIGRSTDPQNRIHGHLSRAASSLMLAWIRTLDRERPSLQILSWHDSEEAAQAEERNQIRLAEVAGVRLLNVFRGGEEPRRRRLRSDGFGDRLRECRKQKGWSQKMLSRATGLCQPEISRTEGGYRNCPSADRALRLAHALGVSVEWLVFGERAGEVLRWRDPGVPDGRKSRCARSSPIDPASSDPKDTAAKGAA